MRLIDAAALKEVYTEKSSEAVCGVGLCKAIISQIDAQPTVDAIPVEWIENNYAWLIAEGKNDVVDVLTEMIEEWRHMAERKEI